MGYLTILKIGAPIAFFVFVLFHINNDRERTEELGAIKLANDGFASAAIEQQERITRLTNRAEARNKEVELMVAEQKEKIAESKLIAANNAMYATQANADLAQARFEIIERIQNGDEELADWVDWDVPLSSIELLRNAKEGGPDVEGMRAGEDPGNSR